MNPARKPPRVVLDTNVLVSALAFGPTSPPAQILGLIRSGKLNAVISPFIMEELERTLEKTLGWEKDPLARLLKKLRLLFGVVSPRLKINIVQRKPSDNEILACAVEGEATVLITGDLKDLRPLGHFQRIEILTPREFLHKYFPETAHGPLR